MWTAKAPDSAERRMLVIVTTIPLAPATRAKEIARRSPFGAAQDYLANSKDALRHPHEPVEGLEGRQGLRIRRRAVRPAPSFGCFPVVLPPRRALLINPDCDRLRPYSRRQRAAKLAPLRRTERVERHDECWIVVRSDPARASRRSGPMGLDRRSRRRLRNRRHDRARQRGHRDHRQRLGGRHHDVAHRAFLKSSTRSRSEPWDCSCSGWLRRPLHHRRLRAFNNPLLTAVSLTLILGAALVTSGIIRSSSP